MADILKEDNIDDLTQEGNADWTELPIPILQNVFALLPLKNRARCAQICWNWFEVFHSDHPWRKFVFKNHVMVRRKFVGSEWQYSIDHNRLRLVLINVAHRWRTLECEPVTNLFDLYDFCHVVTNYARSTHELDKLNNFKFEWKLHAEVEDENQAGTSEKKKVVYGTGGMMLECLSKLLAELVGLKSLKLINLQLKPWDADQLLMELLEQFSNQLELFCLLNSTLYSHPFLHVGLFLQLKLSLLAHLRWASAKMRHPNSANFVENYLSNNTYNTVLYLHVSPQHLNDDVILTIADLKLLRIFCIVQDELTQNAIPCSPMAWRKFEMFNQLQTKVFLIIQGKPKDGLLIQPAAPVYGIIFERSCGQLTKELADDICAYYSYHLRLFLQLGLERCKRSNQFEDRIDYPIVQIASRCRCLIRIAIREKIATSTAIILSTLSKKKKFELYMRRNGLLKRLCWRRNDILELEMDFPKLREKCKEYDKTLEEITELTGSENTVLSDKRYKDMIKWLWQ